MDQGRMVAMLSALVRFLQTPLFQLSAYQISTISGLRTPEGFYVLDGRDGDRAIFYLDLHSKRWRILFVGRHDEYERYLNRQFHSHVREIIREGGGR